MLSAVLHIKHNKFSGYGFCNTGLCAKDRDTEVQDKATKKVRIDLTRGRPQYAVRLFLLG